MVMDGAVMASMAGDRDADGRRSIQALVKRKFDDHRIHRRMCRGKKHHNHGHNGDE